MSDIPDFALLQKRYGEFMREPHPSELDFFTKNPKVTGMATEDQRIIINPAIRDEKQKQSIFANELTRLLMRMGHAPQPTFPITEEQRKIFSTINEGKPYGSDQDIRETIAARMFSGDPSAGAANPLQLRFLEELRRHVQ